MSNVNDRVKLVREKLGLSQKEFAAKLGVAQGQISEMEKYKRRVTQATKDLIILAYSVNVDWLETGSGEMFADKQKLLSHKESGCDINYELLETILIAIDHHMETKNKIATPAEKAKLAASFYKYFVASGITNIDLKSVRKQIDSSIDIVSTIL